MMKKKKKQTKKTPLQNIYIYIVKRLFILLDKKNFFEKAIV